MEEDKKNVESQDHIAISKVAEAVGNSQMTQEQIEEKIDKALKICYKLIEDKADNYIPVNADPAKKNRLIADLKNSAKIDMFNRVLSEGVDNLEGLTQDIAVDAVKPIVPVEDRGEKPVSKADRIQERLNEEFIKNFEELFGNEEKDMAFQDSFKDTIQRISNYKNCEDESKDVRNVIESLVNDDIEKILDSEDCNDRTRLAIATIIENEAESLKMGNARIIQAENICKLLTLNNEYANNYAKNLAQIHEFDIFDYDENGNMSINKQKALDIWKQETTEYYERQGLDAKSKESQEYLDIMCSEESINRDFDENLKTYKREHPELIPKNSKEMKKTIERSERQAFFMEQIYHNDEDFEEKMNEWVSGNVESAQKFIDEDIEMIKDHDDKVNQLKEIVKKIEKNRIKESFLEDNVTFEENMTNLVNVNPSAAQEFLKEFLENPENSKIKNYDFKVMTLQDRIVQAQKERTTESRETAFPSVEKADISAIVEDNGPKLTDDKTNENSEKKQEDDDLSL